MLGPKTELRVLAAIVALVCALAAPPAAAFAAPSEYSSTLTFLSEKFVGGKTLDGFSPGNPDFGFTLEAMLQRKALGQKLIDQLAAVKANLADTTVFNKASVYNYAYTITGTTRVIKPGLAGKFLFVSAALGVPNAPLRNGIIADLKKAVGSNGLIASSNGNTFDYAWTILGLATNQQNKLANVLAQKLVGLQRQDGGFGTDLTGDVNSSSADATGIAIQSLVYAKRSASSAQATIEQKSLVSASAYLKTSQLGGDHWESFGDVDVNGTAYAAMGLKAAGANITSVQAWLKARVAPGGGLTTPWSNGVGDVFATAQGVTPLLGLSYLNLVTK
jgi:hypothetical protein